MHALPFVHRFFFLRAAYFLLIAAALFPSLVTAMPIGSDRMPHFEWKRILMKHQLPAHPISIGSATGLGDFVAVINSKKDHGAGIYLLDHSNLHLGWQKKGTFEHATVCSVQYGLGRFFIFGVDTKNNHSVVASSADSGSTWNQQEIPSSTSHYDLAAFSSKQGLVTGRDGAVARTTDGINWTQIIAPTGSEKKVFALQHSPDEELGFVIIEASPQKRDGFFLVDDFSQKEPLSSTDGITWKKTEPMANTFTSASGEFLIYQGKGFAYHYAGVDTGSDYSVTPAQNSPPHFKATQASTAPQIKILDVITCPIGQRTGWIYLGKDLKTERSLIIYSGNRAFFVADASPTALENPIIAICAALPGLIEKENSADHAVIAIANDGAAYTASTTLTF